eukprot:scaffold64174_cov50-Cyclotella_meneghiniana.AAC.1
MRDLQVRSTASVCPLWQATTTLRKPRERLTIQAEPRRSRLGVSNYERISMLSNIVQNMYTDPEWVASEYLKRCKKGAWKKENTVDALKCFNLEGILTASQFNLETPEEVGMEKYMEGFQLGMARSRSRPQ